MVFNKIPLDINNIIIKDKPPASDYFNSFIELIEIGVFSKEFAYQIAPSTGYRDIEGKNRKNGIIRAGK